MSGYTETFLGDVWPWEVDPTEHFTVSRYYQKFQSACWRYLKLNKVDAARARTTAALTLYRAELRVRDVFRVETALVEAGASPVLGHRVINAETGTLCTEMLQYLDGVTLEGPTVPWEGGAWEQRDKPGPDARWMPSSTAVVRPDDVDWTGAMSLECLIQNFSSANTLVMAAFGLTPDYLTRARIGLSTFEFQLEIGTLARAGDLIDIHSCLAHLGGSSLRFCHRMTDGVTGEGIAELSQFGVHLDLDARRPARIPDDLRERARELLGAPA